jgi:hypothetical protein
MGRVGLIGALLELGFSQLHCWEESVRVCGSLPPWHVITIWIRRQRAMTGLEKR